MNEYHTECVAWSYHSVCGETGLKWHSSIEAAMTAAEEDPSIWKVSFWSYRGETIRLVRNQDGEFYYQKLIPTSHRE